MDGNVSSIFCPKNNDVIFSKEMSVQNDYCNQNTPEGETVKISARAIYNYRFRIGGKDWKEVTIID